MNEAKTPTPATACSSPPFGFDPLSRAFRADPWAVYEAMRREDPVHRSPLGVWVLTRYDDVRACLRDPRFVMGDFWPRQEAMLESLPLRVRAA